MTNAPPMLTIPPEPKLSDFDGVIGGPDAYHIAKQNYARELRTVALNLAERVRELQLESNTHDAAATMYAQQVAHWIDKHDKQFERAEKAESSLATALQAREAAEKEARRKALEDAATKCHAAAICCPHESGERKIAMELKYAIRALQDTQQEPPRG